MHFFPAACLQHCHTERMPDPECPCRSCSLSHLMLHTLGPAQRARPPAHSHVPAPVPCVLQGDEPAPEDEEEYEADEAEDDSEGSDEGESEDEVRAHSPARAPPLSCSCSPRRACVQEPGCCCKAAALRELLGSGAGAAAGGGLQPTHYAPGSPAILTYNAVLHVPAAAAAAA